MIRLLGVHWGLLGKKWQTRPTSVPPPESPVRARDKGLGPASPRDRPRDTYSHHPPPNPPACAASHLRPPTPHTARPLLSGPHWLRVSLETASPNTGP